MPKKCIYKLVQYKLVQYKFVAKDVFQSTHNLKASLPEMKVTLKQIIIFAVDRCLPQHLPIFTRVKQYYLNKNLWLIYCFNRQQAKDCEEYEYSKIIRLAQCV